MRRFSHTVLVLCILFSLGVVASAGAAPAGADRGPWAPNVWYNVNDTVTYNGQSYRAIQAHTSQTGWEPPNVPALWGLISGPTTTPSRTPTKTNTPGGPTSTRTPTRTNTPIGPTKTPTRTPTSGAGSCSGVPQYVAGTSYSAGQIVQNIGNKYSCTIAGWCSSSAAWAYAPGTGLYWTEAWAFVSTCSTGPTSTPTRTSSPPPPGSRISAPYIDVSPGASSPIMQLANNGSGNKHYTLAFILGRGCSASWFGTYEMNSAEANAIGTRINELRAVGGDVLIAFGGAAAPELANVCPDVSSLQAQYQAVINKYNLRYIDLDIEDFSPTAIDMRNKALKNLAAANPNLRIHYTLGVLPTGMTQAQLDVLNNAKANGTRVDLVNIMAMDYYQNVQDMGGAAIQAAQATRTQLNNLGFTNTQIGITPMIGRNDSPETFTLEDAQQVINWAKNNNIALVAFWSVGRDNGGCPNGTVSPSCSGIAQSLFQFSSIFRGFEQ